MDLKHLPPIKEQIKRLYKIQKKPFFPRKAHLVKSINALKRYSSDYTLPVETKYKNINKSILNITKHNDQSEIKLAIESLSKCKRVGFSRKNKCINHIIIFLCSYLTDIS